MRRRAILPSRARPSGLTLLFGLFRIPLCEAFDAAGRVDQLLLAGEERMALRADLDAQLFLGGAGRPRLAAGAVHLHLMILRMDLCFHEFTPLDALTTGSIFEKFSSARAEETHDPEGDRADQSGHWN